MAPALLLHRFSVHKTNYYKAFITLIYTLAALAIFYWKGNIHWYYGLEKSNVFGLMVTLCEGKGRGVR